MTGEAIELLSSAIRLFFAYLDMFNFVKLLESKDCPDLQRLYPSCISVSLDAGKVLVTKVLGRTFTQTFLRSCISTRFSQLQGGIFVFRNCMSPNAFCQRAADP